MKTVKSFESEELKVWIEQHNEFFILKYKEKDNEVQALDAMKNLALVLDFFDTLIGKDHRVVNC